MAADAFPAHYRIMTTADPAAPPSAPATLGRIAGRWTALRGYIRSRETGIVLIAVVIGIAAGVLVSGMAQAVQALHVLLFRIDPDQRLSGVPELHSWRVIVWPAAGGAAMALSGFLWSRLKRPLAVDPIEANALRGGRMSLWDSLYVALQTLISNGFGASVGLEAGYTQMGAGLASALGLRLRLRRVDMRVLVGCGAAAAIAAGFGAPLTGAFYGFEIVIGAYSVASVAPVMAASLAATLTAHALHGALYRIRVPVEGYIGAEDYPAFILLGVICAGVGIALMRAVSLVEQGFSRIRMPAWVRPIVGGLVVGALAWISPQALSAGHGALFEDMATKLALPVLGGLVLLKMAASAVSLGSGFRGGLFFASLLIGALLGQIYADGMALLIPTAGIDREASALVGMGAFAVAIVGGPLTMSFLVLETTGDYALTGAVLGASIISSLAVRETFGYSFSTWRLHLRGESIRSAHDVGWMRSLTVGRLMREDTPSILASAPLEEFKRKFPLGSTQRVILLDGEGRYDGIAVVTDAHARTDAADQAKPISTFARLKEATLTPAMNVQQAMALFDRTESEALAVVDGPQDRKVLGLLTESYALRRYAEELEKSRRGLIGER